MGKPDWEEVQRTVRSLELRLSSLEGRMSRIEGVLERMPLIQVKKG
jgi:hypothetical protein